MYDQLAQQSVMQGHTIAGHPAAGVPAGGLTTCRTHTCSTHSAGIFIKATHTHTHVHWCSYYTWVKYQEQEQANNVALVKYAGAVLGLIRLASTTHRQSMAPGAELPGSSPWPLGWGPGPGAPPGGRRRAACRLAAVLKRAALRGSGREAFSPSATTPNAPAAGASTPQ
jgi:hypothetical protein